jgi:hypothetical protein
MRNVGNHGCPQVSSRSAAPPLVAENSSVCWRLAHSQSGAARLLELHRNTQRHCLFMAVDLWIAQHLSEISVFIFETPPSLVAHFSLLHILPSTLCFNAAQTFYGDSSLKLILLSAC